MKNGKDATQNFEEAFNQATDEVQVFIDKLTEFESGGYFDGMPEIQNKVKSLGTEWTKVIQKINSEKPEVAEQIFKSFLQKLVDATKAAGDKINKRYKDLL